MRGAGSSSSYGSLSARSVAQRWAAIAIVLSAILPRCSKRTPPPPPRGGYVVGAKLLPSKHVDDRSELLRGPSFFVRFTQTEPGLGCVSESTKQTDVYIELARAPTKRTVIDLAKDPKSARMEHGAQALTFVSTSAAGTLVITPKAGGGYDAAIDAAFASPRLGKGSRRFEDRATLVDRSHMLPRPAPALPPPRDAAATEPASPPQSTP